VYGAGRAAHGMDRTARNEADGMEWRFLCMVCVDTKGHACIVMEIRTSLQVVNLLPFVLKDHHK
jgi:hypothetical protein